MTWCIDCGEDFHDDDTGGYNPACACGLHCRSCHEAEQREKEAWDTDDIDSGECRGSAAMLDARRARRAATGSAPAVQKNLATTPSRSRSVYQMGERHGEIRLR